MPVELRLKSAETIAVSSMAGEGADLSCVSALLDA